MEFQEAKRRSLDDKWKPIQRDIQMLVFRVQQACGFCTMLTEHSAIPKCKIACSAYSICKGGTGLVDLEDKLQEASDMTLAIIKQIEGLEERTVKLKEEVMKTWMLTDLEFLEVLKTCQGEASDEDEPTAMAIVNCMKLSACAQACKLVDWLEQLCTEHPWDIEKKFYRLRKDCPECIVKFLQD